MEPGIETAAADNQVAMQVVRHIQGLIEQGKLRRGERLPPEREFARELKVSRASLRAGVGYLAAMGVLKVRHGVGNFVADGPPALGTASFEMLYALHGFTQHQMFEARLVIEGNLAEMAAERGSEADFAAMEEEITDMYATSHDPQAYLIHDVRFHRIIGEASGNPILGALMETISASFYDTRRMTVERTRDLKATTEMHREIHEALRQRKGAEARRLMERHLHAAEEGIASEASGDGQARPRRTRAAASRQVQGQ